MTQAAERITPDQWPLGPVVAEGGSQGKGPILVSKWLAMMP